MFISQGWSGSHLLKKPGWGFPDSGWSGSGNGCCAGHLCGTSSGWFLQNNCSWWFPLSIGLVAVGAAGCSFGIAGATGAVPGAAVTGLTGNNPFEVLVSASGLTASGWCSQMWSHAHLYWPPPMTWTKYEPCLAWWITVAGSQRVLASLSTETVCPAYSRDFSLQWWSWYAALWLAWSLRWFLSAAAWESLCLILWGTVVLITLWSSISAGEWRWPSMGVLLYANKAR